MLRRKRLNGILDAVKEAIRPEGVECSEAVEGVLGPDRFQAGDGEGDAGAAAVADYLSVRCAGDDEDVFYVFGPYGKIAYSADFGATLQDKRGNLGDFSGINRFVNLCGG